MKHLPSPEKLQHINALQNLIEKIRVETDGELLRQHLAELVREYDSVFYTYEPFTEEGGIRQIARFALVRALSKEDVLMEVPDIVIQTQLVIQLILPPVTKVIYGRE